jgi:hypothetical protein
MSELVNTSEVAIPAAEVFTSSDIIFSGLVVTRCGPWWVEKKRPGKRSARLSTHQGPQRVTTRPEKIMSELVNTSEVAIPAVPKVHPFHYLIGTKRLLTHIFKELAHLLTVQVQQVNLTLMR